MKMYEECIKHPHSIDSETSPALIDPNRVALFKSTVGYQGYILVFKSNSDAVF